MTGAHDPVLVLNKALEALQMVKDMPIDATLSAVQRLHIAQAHNALRAHVSQMTTTEEKKAVVLRKTLTTNARGLLIPFQLPVGVKSLHATINVELSPVGRVA